MDLITPYFSKYYEIVNQVVEKLDRENAESFVVNLCPSFMAREEDEEKLNELLKNCNPDKNYFKLLIQKFLE